MCQTVIQESGHVWVPMAIDKDSLNAIKSRGMRLHFGLGRVLFRELGRKPEEALKVGNGRR